MFDNQEQELPRFYICPVCFNAGDEQQTCHGQLMIPCKTDKPEDCRPLMSDGGELKTRAPRWFIWENFKRKR
jgi:hypothetical protein